MSLTIYHIADLYRHLEGSPPVPQPDALQHMGALVDGGKKSTSLKLSVRIKVTSNKHYKSP